VRATLPRRQLGRELRQLRSAAGLTQDQAAVLLHFSGAKLTRIERGYQVPRYHELRAMLDQYGLPTDMWQLYLDMADRARAKAWYHAYGVGDYSYISMEDEAVLLRQVQSGFVPDLLQTRDYMRATIEALNRPMSSSRVDTTLALREHRQRRLTADTDPLAVHAVLDEAVLRPGLPRTVVRDQLNHLIMVSELDNVTIQIVGGTRPHQGMYGNVTVISFADKQEPDVGYIEHVAGQDLIETPDGVARCALAFANLARAALSHDDSVRLIEELADNAGIGAYGR
jgi:transcriptional regulator with XRE-family HTH domain